MANISMKFSQAVVDTSRRIELASPAQLNGDVGAIFDGLFQAVLTFTKPYSYYSSWSFQGSDLKINFSDGASQVFHGVTGLNSGKGQFSATSYEFYKNGVFDFSALGKLNYDYTISTVNGVQQIAFNSATSNGTAFVVASDYPTYSTSYSKDFGNVSIGVKGNWTSNAGGNTSGTIERIVQTADKFLKLNLIEGSFNLSGNTGTIAQGLTNSVVSGTLTGVQSEYYDGSYSRISGISTYVRPDQKFDNSFFADPSYFSSDDVISVDLPPVVYDSYLIASGAGNDQISINGGGSSLNVNAGTGNDSITVGTGSHQVDGGEGLDIVQLAGSLSAYAIRKGGASYSIKKNGSTDTSNLTNVESLKFSDKTVNLGVQKLVSVTAPQSVQKIMELYVAFFNRVPDADGLSFWIGQLNNGKSINQIADAFYGAGVQFSSLTGFSSSMTNTDFVNVIYKNALGRKDGADSEGLAYWTGALADGSATRGSLVSAILTAAHSYKGDAKLGWVADLLDNKLAVSKTFAIDFGLGYVNAADAVSNGMAIVGAITPSNISDAIKLIGVTTDVVTLN
nr:DUF4214 domain-containing protein [uncultured Undibacterium sp.]